MTRQPTRSGRIGTAIGTLALALALIGAAQAGAGDIGMAADDAGDRAVVFDSASGAILGAVAVGPGSVGDCVVLPQHGLGFITDFEPRLWVVDVAQTPPVLAAGTNPIALSIPGGDVAASPDGRHLVTCGNTHSVSVVDVAERAETATFDLGHSCNSVEVCADRSVLVGELLLPDDRSVRRLVLGADGELTDTGEVLLPDFPTNLHCAPVGATALVLQLGWDVSSTTVPGLTILDNVVAEATPSAAAFEPAGDRFYLRTEGAISVYDYDPLTGSISDPVFTIAGTGDFVPLGGIDTLALDAAARRLYAPSDGAVGIFDADTGAALTPIVDAGADFTGVCLASRSGVFTDGFESGDTSRWSSTVP